MHYVQSKLPQNNNQQDVHQVWKLSIKVSLMIFAIYAIYLHSLKLTAKALKKWWGILRWSGFLLGRQIGLFSGANLLLVCREVRSPKLRVFPTFRDFLSNPISSKGQHNINQGLQVVGRRPADRYFHGVTWDPHKWPKINRFHWGDFTLL